MTWKITGTSHPSIVTDGLVLNLDAANQSSYPGSGTTWTDLTGNGNDGTLQNGVGFNAADGGSLSFDGADDYVNCGNSSTVNLSSSFTSSCWFRVSNSAPNTTDSKGLIAKYTGFGGNNRSQMLSFAGNNNSVTFIVSSDGTNTASTAKSISYSSISRETWYYLTGVFTASQKMELFLNGLLVTSDTTTLSQVFSSSTEPLAIGRQAIAQNGFAFKGNIAQVSIYNRALTAAEVLQNYNALKGRFGL